MCGKAAGNSNKFVHVVVFHGM